MTQSIDIDGHHVIANCAAERDVAARSLLKALEQMHRAGPALHPGSHIDFGWSLLQIEAHPGHWVVCEPEYGTDPMTWKPQVDDTLSVLQQQAATRALVGNAKSERTRGDQWLLVQPGAFDAAEVYLHRSAATTAQDSGWYIGVENASASKPVEKASPMIAGLLLQAKPAWLSVLALPKGFLVHFGRDSLIDVHDDNGARLYPAEKDA
jgi:hypothetical protein